MNKNFLKNVDFDLKYIYFPLHVEPERELLIESPYFTDQVNVIENIAKSIPCNYVLYVKEHPGMKDNGWHNQEFYERILTLPNVVMIHPDIKSHELIKNSSLVINIAGDSAFEAVFYQKPSIVFTNVDYSVLPSVHYVENMKDLPSTIKSCINTKVDLDNFRKYINYLDKNSFDFDYISIRADFNDTLYYPGFLGEIEINEQKIQEFIQNHEEAFMKLADQNIKKINNYEPI